MYSMTPSGMTSAPSSYGLAAPQNSMLPTQQAPAMTMPNAYAHGGRTKRGKLVMAHFSPKELDVLDHLQGKQERCPRTNMRSYTHLEELLKNPHILSSVHHHAHHAQAHHHPHHEQHAHHHAHGGPEHYGHHLDQVAHHGVHGDTELALIGPHTHHVFNKLAAPGTVTNHIDGRPQYWSLGGALGGLWNTIKGAASQAAPYIGAAGKAIMPAVMPALSSAVGGRFGPLGTAAVEGLGSLANKGFDALSEMGSEENRGLASTLGEGANAAMQARQQGMSPLQSAGAGLSQMGSRFGGGVGGAMQGVGGAMREGQGARDIARRGAMGAYHGAGGASSLMNAAKGLMNQYGQGMSPRQIAGSAAAHGLGALQRSIPTRESMQNQDYMREMPFGNQYV